MPNVHTLDELPDDIEEQLTGSWASTPSLGAMESTISCGPTAFPGMANGMYSLQLGRGVPVTPVLHIHGIPWDYSFGPRAFNEWSMPLELLIQGVREIHINHYQSAKGLRAIRLKKEAERRDQIFAFRLVFNSMKVWQDNTKLDHPYLASYDCVQPHIEYDIENGLLIYTDRGESYVFRAEDCAFTGEITRASANGS